MMRVRWGLMLVVLLVTVGGCATVQNQPAPTSTLDKLTATRRIILRGCARIAQGAVCRSCYTSRTLPMVDEASHCSLVRLT